jgi:hypothetical protein
MRKKHFILILSLLLLLVLFISCGDQTDSNNTQVADVTSGDVSDISEKETTTNYLDTIPVLDFGGETFTIFCRSDKIYEVYAESEDGEIINDTIFARNRAVEERYNITINYLDSVGGWGDQGAFFNKVTNSVMAGENAFDMTATYMAYTAYVETSGIFTNLYNVPYLELTNDWWIQDFINTNTYAGKLYMTTGDISLSMLENLYAVFFNKQLHSDYKLDNMYEIVKSGKWTFDMLNQMSAAVVEDINGDGIYDVNDRLGFVTNNHGMRAMPVAMGVEIASLNSDGTLELVYYNERSVDIFDKLYNMLFNNNYAYIHVAADHMGNDILLPMFKENRILFLTNMLNITDTLRDMDTDFGILPFPKYNEQGDYRSISYDGMSVFGIPSSVKNLEMSGIVMETLCYLSSQELVSVFYDIKLKDKISRDDDSAEMLDIIRDGLYFDFGYVHTMGLSYIFSTFGDLLSDGKDTFSSAYETKANTITQNIETIIKGFEECET